MLGTPLYDPLLAIVRIEMRIGGFLLLLGLLAYFVLRGRLDISSYPMTVGVLIGCLSPVWLYMLSPMLNAERICYRTCMRNQRQVSIAIQMYCQDHDGRFPATIEDIAPYDGDHTIFQCIRHDNAYTQPRILGGFGYNGLLAGHTLKEVADPATLLLLADSIQPRMVMRSRTDIDRRRHGTAPERGFNATFVDGHVEFLPEHEATRVPMAVPVPVVL
jgi:prepilin-type processing-associated H-X9-DG protein